MVDSYSGPFGDYTNGTQVVSAAANTEIQANITKLKGLFPDPADAGSAPHPDFDLIPPEMVTRIRTEIDAMAAAIAAAPDT
jgi:hypothetical protein